MSTLWWILIGIVVFYLVGGFIATEQVTGDHPQWRKLIASPEDFALQATVVESKSRDGISIRGWWIPASGSVRATVILAHGQSGNRSHMLGRTAFLVSHGFNALPIDLRLHGESGGDYMTPGYLEALDLLGAVDFVAQQGDSIPIIVLGYSYGATAALHAAAQSERIGAVIADAAFISYSDMVKRASTVVMKDEKSSFGAKLGMMFLKVPLLDEAAGLMFTLRTGVHIPTDKADAIASIPNIRQPILFIAGEEDPLAPADNMRIMLEKSSHPLSRLVILRGATHSTHGKAREQYEAAVLEFLDSVLERRTK